MQLTANSAKHNVTSDEMVHNNSSTNEPEAQLPPIWLLISNYEAHFVGGAFALTAILSLGFCFYLCHHRSSNQVGGLLSVIFVISFLFSTSRSLLVVDNLVAGIRSIVASLDCLRIPSICSIFALVFVAIIRSCEPIFARTSTCVKFLALLALALNYAIAFAPKIMEEYYPKYHEISTPVEAGCGMYFMTLLFIMALSYILMMPKIISTARRAKLTTAGPNRLISAALICFLCAFLLIIYVLFLLLGFVLIRPGIDLDFLHPSWRQHRPVLRVLHVLGTNMTEAVTTALLVIASVLLIVTEKRTESPSPIVPEMHGLLSGRDTLASRQPIILGSGTNGYHSLTLSKHDHYHYR